MPTEIPRRIPLGTPLARCPQWATTHVLSVAVLEALTRLAALALNEGRPAYRHEVLAALVIFETPTNAQELARVVVGNGRDGIRIRGVPGSRGGELLPGTRQITVRMPSPVLRRLDALVDVVQAETGDPVTRREMITAVVLRRGATLSGTEVAGLIERYRGAVVDAAFVPQRPRAWILRDTRLRPGRRPLR